MISLFFDMPLFWLGTILFGYFVYIAPEDCPKEYMTLKKDGGQLDNMGSIHKYCEPNQGFHHWTLKKDARVTFDDVLQTKKP